MTINNLFNHGEFGWESILVIIQVVNIATSSVLACRVIFICAAVYLKGHMLDFVGVPTQQQSRIQ